MPTVVIADTTEGLGDVCGEATRLERRETLGLMLYAAHVDVHGDRLVRIEAKLAFVALFRQVEGLQERAGCFYLAQSGCIRHLTDHE